MAPLALTPDPALSSTLSVCFVALRTSATGRFETVRSSEADVPLWWPHWRDRPPGDAGVWYCPKVGNGTQPMPLERMLRNYSAGIHANSSGSGLTMPAPDLVRPAFVTSYVVF